MKLLRTGQAGRVFQLSPQEKRLLFDTLKLYPRVPAAHHRLSRQPATPQSEENQRLLAEALAEQRAGNRRRVLAMLHQPERFREVPNGFELTLSPGDLEWLLQVLNDVRVGCWLELGEPEAGEEPTVTPQNARYVLAMELAGFFQSMLLAALGVSESPDWLA